MSTAATPEQLSARQRLSPGQRVTFTIVAILLLTAFVLAPQGTLLALVAVFTFLYLAVFVERVLLLRCALRNPGTVSVPPQEARAVPDEELPVYTILVPAYREPTVLPQLLSAIQAIDYPPDRLEVLLLND